MMNNQARVQGGGGGGGAQSQKKVIRANFKLFPLYFATFFSQKYYFLCCFLSWASPEKLKNKPKKNFQIFGPPSRIPGHATDSNYHLDSNKIINKNNPQDNQPTAYTLNLYDYYFFIYKYTCSDITLGVTAANPINRSIIT